jgi:TolB protein
MWSGRARPHLALSGRVLVWSDEETEDTRDILAFDLEKDTRMRITDDASAQGWPTAAGNLIVWTNERNGAGDIYAYDLDTQEEFPIVTEYGWQGNPRIWGNTLVWTDNRDEDNQDIYGATLEY